MQVTLNKVCTSYLKKPILKDVTFTINEKDKIGIVGINGIGKSTLLKTLIGIVELDSGEIYKKKDLTMAYLPQTPEFDNNKTIIDIVLESNKEVGLFEAESSLNKMGLLNHEIEIKNLSGGEKKRLGLAIIMLSNAELLLLDEPTNHLDIWMINYLEKYLVKTNKTIILVTHDRYFLERVTNKIVEIERPNSYGGNALLYSASYSKFLELKAERLQELKAAERRLASILRKEIEWVKMNPQARSTKSRERLERFEKLEADTKEVSDIIKDQGAQIEIKSIASRLSKKTIEIINLTKSINGKLLFKDFSYNIYRFDRLGIIGSNGCGKTTLFNTILGLKQPDYGEIIIGDTCKLGYFKQEDEIFKSSKRVLEYLKEFGEYIDTPDGLVSASQLLESYLFSPDIQQMPLSTLSGGEKRRLQLLTVLISNPNILFLDEPTNDLDIYTIELLEAYLETFKGAIIVVSHDRYFLDKVTNHLLAFEEGSIKEVMSNVTDYINETVTKKEVKPKMTKKASEAPSFTPKEKKEFATIEEDIAFVENKIKEIDTEMNLFGTDYQKQMELTKQKEELLLKLDKLIERWEYLTELNERINIYWKGTKK